jgi:hypothetical protein
MLLPLLPLLLLPEATATAVSVVQVECDGSTATAALTTGTATCTVTAPAAVAWLRFDRVDECTSYGCARSSPFYHARAWGMKAIQLPFVGVNADNPAAGPRASHPVGAVRVAVSGWSSRWNATMLGNSSAVEINYDWSAFRSQRLDVEATELRMGTVELRGIVLNSSLPSAEHWTFWSYSQCPTCPRASSDKAPHFKSADINSQLQATGANGTVVVAFSVPGIYYWAVSGSRDGAGVVSSAGGTGSPGCEGCIPYTTPLALILPGPDGQPGNDTLPAGFAGKTMMLKPLVATPYQLCLVTFNVTVFSGAKLYLPLCAGTDASGASKLALATMKYAAVRHPAWMTVFFTGAPSNSSAYDGRATISADSKSHDGALVVTTAPLIAINQLLDFTHLPVWVQFSDPPSSTFDLQVTMHESSTPPTASSACWQPFTATAVDTPTVPLPTKLLTSVTFAYDDMLLTSPDGKLSMVGLYSQLGFNIVPFMSTQAYLPDPVFGPPPPLLWPGNRTNGPWEQPALKFGPQTSYWDYFDFVSGKKGGPNATILSSMGVKPANMAAQMAKWERAINYSTSCGGMPDIAYDGALLQHDFQHFCEMAAFAKPDFVFADNEGWGDAWQKWHKQGYVLKSPNALSQRLPGESDENLAFRMLVQMLAGWVSCLPKVSPKTQPMWYGTALAPAEAFLAAGVVPQYSSYSDIFAPARWPATVKRQKQLLGNKAPLVPWLTSCCWGQMNADELRSATLHSFGSGAAGFSWFRDICFDDPGKLLALSDAVAIATHHETHLAQGMPAREGEDIELIYRDGEQPLIWSASVHARSMWLAVTPRRGQTVLRFAAALLGAREGGSTACLVTIASACVLMIEASNDGAAAGWEVYEVPLHDAIRVAEDTVIIYISRTETLSRDAGVEETDSKPLLQYPPLPLDEDGSPHRISRIPYKSDDGSASDLRFLSYFDFNRASVKDGGANLLQFSLAQLPSWRAELRATGTKGMYDMGDGGPAIWNRTARTLALDWEEHLRQGLSILKAHFVSGDIPVVMLGDEVNDSGISIQNLTAVAAATRAVLEGWGVRHVLLFVNEGADVWNSSDARTFSGFMSRVPATIDVVSTDRYRCATFNGSVPQRCDPLTEFELVREAYETEIFPKLSAQQRVFVVPGLFGDSSIPVDEQDAQLADKLESYWRWAKTEPRIVGIMPWHYETRKHSKYNRLGNHYEALGIEAFPKLQEVLRNISSTLSFRAKSDDNEAALAATGIHEHSRYSGASMPTVSLGHPDQPGSCCRTHPTNRSCCTELSSLQKWWAAGGIGVDTAFVYGTQVALGEALAEFRPKRVFVTTKIPCAGTTAEAAALIAQDLRDLKLRTVDLLVIHNNRDDSHFCNSETNVTATWKALQSAHAAGQARSIVSPPALRLQLIIGSTV